MLKRITLIFLLFMSGCSDNASPTDPKESIIAPTPASTVAVTKPPQSHTAADLKKAFNSAAPVTNNIQQGAKMARKCFTCHTLTQYKKVGPGLASIYNRAAGSMPDMHYSPALQHANWQWDETHLAAWLCNSHKALQTFSGNPDAHSKMPPQHICDPDQQANIIAYMKTL